MRVLFVSILLCFLVSACGKGQESAQQKTGMKSGSTAMSTNEGGTGAMAPPSGNGKTVDGTYYPDHSKDIQEFNVRSSLAGVERMIEQYKKDGYDTSELENQKTKLEQELKQITG